jgi:acetyl esterase/lipase
MTSSSNTALTEFNWNQLMKPTRRRWLAFWFLFLFVVSQTADSAEPTHRDLEYAKASSTSLRLDLYLPSERAVRPVIVWIHGGAWRSGSKSDVPITPMLSAGFAIASVDYRLSPEAPFPAQMHDIKAAIRFLRANCDRFQLDSNRFVISGSSAGGHLAALAGVSDGVADLEGTLGEHLQVSSRVQSIVSFFGASNLQTILAQSTPFGLNVRVPALDLFLGGQPDAKPELARLASPVAHVDRNDPPLWLYHGDQDPQMPINQAHELQGAYQRASLPVSFEVLHNSKHGGAEFFQEERLRKLSDALLQTLETSSGATECDKGSSAEACVLRDLEYVPNGHEAR